LEARAIREVIQRIQTRRLDKAKSTGAKTADARIEGFDMKTAFFVRMGGYAVRPAPGEFVGLAVTLTAEGFVFLYAQGKVKPEDLETTSIEDKSKADGLAKLVVCIQALVTIHALHSGC